MKPRRETTYKLLARFLGAYDRTKSKAFRKDSREKARYLAKELAHDGLKVVRK